MTATEWIADRCAKLACGRLRRRFPEWSEAMAAEQHQIASSAERVGWAFGVLRASFQLEPPDLVYPLVLLLGVSEMTAYQWSADESPTTVVVLIALAVVLGFVRPARYLLSGLAVGTVVAAVNVFETVSGVRPAYEDHIHTLVHCLRWLPLTAPAIFGAGLGRLARDSLSTLAGGVL